MRLGQTVIIRTDLFDSHLGLTSAQVAHIHALPMIEALQLIRPGGFEIDVERHQKLVEWSREPFIFVRQVPNLEALNYFKQKAEDQGVYVKEWRDTVNVNISRNQVVPFSDVVVGICIGPDGDDEIKMIVGDLPFLS
jgi:peptidyl-tRNA hydrolase